jgi:hypothetical protein
MQAGRIGFDGPPAELTTEKALEVYGTEGDSEELRQALGEGPVKAGRSDLPRILAVNA